MAVNMAVRSLRSRKGVFFTIMALLIVAFILAAEQAKTTPLTVNLADTTAARSRVPVMDSYIDTFELQAANSLGTAGYYALENTSQGIAKSGNYVADINATVDNCVRVAPTSCLTANQSLNTTLDRLTTLATSDLGINTTYAVHRVWVTEESPFVVTFWMNISYNVSDAFANWSFSDRTIRIPVETAGIDDPAYSYAYFYHNVTTLRKFGRTPLRRGQFNTTSFPSYYESKLYTPNIGLNPAGAYWFAPSVLQRFAGNLTNGSSCCGIESIVYIYDLNDSIKTDPRLVNWSLVDYQFFSRDTIPQFGCANSAANGSSKFRETTIRMDNYHFSNVYVNLTDADTNSTCK